MQKLKIKFQMQRKDSIQFDVILGWPLVSGVERNKEAAHDYKESLLIQ